MQSSPLQIVIALRQTLQGETRGSGTEVEHGRDDLRGRERTMTAWPSTAMQGKGMRDNAGLSAERAS